MKLAATLPTSLTFLALWWFHMELTSTLVLLKIRASSLLDFYGTQELTLVLLKI